MDQLVVRVEKPYDMSSISIWCGEFVECVYPLWCGNIILNFEFVLCSSGAMCWSVQVRFAAGGGESNTDSV